MLLMMLMVKMRTPSCLPRLVSLLDRLCAGVDVDGLCGLPRLCLDLSLPMTAGLGCKAVKSKSVVGYTQASYAVLFSEALQKSCLR